jgi:hypothetical protein
MPLRLSTELMYATLSEDKPFAEWYVTQFMPAHVPEFAYAISEEGKREMVLQGRRYAERFGIRDVPSQYHFITLMWKVGPNFFEFPGFRETLIDPTLTGPEKINRLYETPGEQAVEAIMRADDRYWYPYMLTVRRP